MREVKEREQLDMQAPALSCYPSKSEWFGCRENICSEMWGRYKLEAH